MSWINSNERQNSSCHVLTLFANFLATTHCSASNTKLTSTNTKEKKTFINGTIMDKRKTCWTSAITYFESSFKKVCSRHSFVCANHYLTVSFLIFVLLCSSNLPRIPYFVLEMTRIREIVVQTLLRNI